eukprot:TRINITY_DN103_c0_g1_i2.p1 TRINITY_DN103_c0_g1~~TRINITY_DN103_c0_g1_i2.p1  ORF type:complete len:391 (-),score=80.44 TRINITY_DN103_c0_g1_i2:322-1494(-)
MTTVMGLRSSVRLVSPMAGPSLSSACSTSGSSSLPSLARVQTKSMAVSSSASSRLGSDFLAKHSNVQLKRQVRQSSAAGAGRGGALSATSFASDPEQLKGAREEIKELLKEKSCHPILIRLGWHDAGTFNKDINEWPRHGGANGSLRFSVELEHAANAGLTNAVKLVQPIKDKFPNVTYADLFQLASATAIEDAGGPKIPMRYGRVDTAGPEECVKEGNLPDAGPPDPADHLRKVFYRMGFSDKDIVALSGAHTVGRSRPERSGWGKPETKYTKDGPGAPGGQSWTVQWLKFDNSYFTDIKEKRDEDLLVLPTDAVLFDDPGFKAYAEKYAADQEVFFKDYAESHAKLSERGSKFDPPEGIFIDKEEEKVTAAVAPEKFKAAAYSSSSQD